MAKLFYPFLLLLNRLRLIHVRDGFSWNSYNATRGLLKVKDSEIHGENHCLTQSHRHFLHMPEAGFESGIVGGGDSQRQCL